MFLETDIAANFFDISGLMRTTCNMLTP